MSKNSSMRMFKRVQFVVRRVHIVREKIALGASFTDYGYVTEASTDHTHMETVNDPFFHANGYATHTHTWKRAFFHQSYIQVCR